jgi:hypothetical protein
MLSELREDNVALTGRLREAHEVADELRDRYQSRSVWALRN